MFAATLLSACAAFAQAPADSLIPSPFVSADTARTLDQKIDRLGTDVAVIKQDVKVVRNELVESPLGNRSWGAELNPLGILFLDEGIGLSGTVSNFSWDRSAEIAFPFYFSNGTAGGNESSVFHVDAQYRRFLRGVQRGFYLSGLVRLEHARYESWDAWYYEAPTGSTTINRLGVGFGLGGRIFSRAGLYWGWNVSVGRFLVGDKIPAGDMPDNPYLAMGDLILDVELLKIGFAF